MVERRPLHEIPILLERLADPFYLLLEACESPGTCDNVYDATLLPTTSACVGTSVDHLYATKVCKLLSNG